MSDEGDGFLGIDIGTTNIKAQMVTASGKSIASKSLPVGISYASGGLAEQDMEEIWLRIKEAVAAVAAESKGAGYRCRGIGMSSQGGALQVLGADGGLCGKVIGWQDSRGKAYDRAETERLGQDWFAARSGSAGAASAIGQVLRLRASGQMPRDASIAWVGDLAIGRLCGNRAHDATSLSEACLLNPAKGCEDGDILRLLGLDPSRLPRLIPADRSAGGLLPGIAEELGLPAGIPVGPAVHDQYAAAIGCGATHAGDTMLGAGTAWVLLAIGDRLQAPVGGIALAGRHPISGLYGQMLSMVNGGACISWAAKALRLPASSVGDLDELMSTVPPGSEGLSFRPLLAEVGGHGLPEGSAGRIDGLRMSHGPAHIVRALVEGLACELGRHLDLLRSGGVGVERIVMCGKAASSSVTPQIIADTTGLPVSCTLVPETSSLGAAMLARSLVESGTGLARIAEEMKPPRRSVEPGEGRRAARERLEAYERSLA